MSPLRRTAARASLFYGLLALSIAPLSGCGQYGLEEYGDVDGAQLRLIPAGDLDYGDVPVGEPVELELIFASTGADAVLIEDIVVQGGGAAAFTPRPVATPRMIQPEVQMPLVVTFRPEREGELNAVLLITTPTLDVPTITRHLTGVGCADSNSDGRCDR